MCKQRHSPGKNATKIFNHSVDVTNLDRDEVREVVGQQLHILEKHIPVS